MFTKKVFVVNRNSDQTEGRGPLIPFCYADTKELALQIINSPIFYTKYGVQGCKEGDYLVRETQLVVFSNFEEFVLSEQSEAAKKALAKLTTEDKEALGLI